MGSQEYFKEYYSRLLDLCKEGFLCDTVIIAGGEALRVHSVLLAAASPELKERLRRQADHDIRCIMLPEINYKTICVAVYFIYTGNLMLPANSDEEYCTFVKSSLINLGLSSTRINECSILYERNNELQFGNLSSSDILGQVDHYLDDVDVDNEESEQEDAFDDDNEQNYHRKNCEKSKKPPNGKTNKRNTSKSKTGSGVNPSTTTASQEMVSNDEVLGENDLEGCEVITMSDVLQDEGTEIIIYESVPFESEVPISNAEKNTKSKTSFQSIKTQNIKNVTAVQPNWPTEQQWSAVCEGSLRFECVNINDDPLDLEQDNNFKISLSLDNYDADGASEQGSVYEIGEPSEQQNDLIMLCLDYKLEEPSKQRNNLTLNTGATSENVTDFANGEPPSDNTPFIVLSSTTNKNYRHEKLQDSVIVKQSDDNENDIIYKCQICKKLFMTKLALRQHKIEHFSAVNSEVKRFRKMRSAPASAQKFQCDKCNKKFSLSRLLNEHQNVHVEGGKSFICSICGCEKSSKSSLWSHKRIHRKKTSNSGISMLCHICGKEYNNRSSMLCHLRRPHAEYKCDKCEATFNSKGNLTRHSLVQHGVYMRCHQSADKSASNGENHVCYVCGFISHSDKAYRAHLRDHRRVCQICSAVFTGDTALEEHAKSTHPDQEYHPPNWCEICEKSFRRDSNLRHHMLRHGCEKPFQCQLCSRKFVSTNTLSAHVKRCNGESRRENKDVELGVTRTADKKFQCNECGIFKASYETMRAHTTYSHSGRLPYSCTECGKKFLYESYLKSHMRIHTGELPFNCGECGKKFRQLAHLSIHMHRHLGTKPYSCELCGKGYSSRVDLCNHYTRLHNLEVVSTKINKNSTHTVNLPKSTDTAATDVPL